MAEMFPLKFVVRPDLSQMADDIDPKRFSEGWERKEASYDQ
jgi:hypothetical protein